MLRIRLRRVGKKKQPMYRIVVADSRAPRDGAFVEVLGYYHPLDNPSTFTIDGERARRWLDRGAQPSDRVSKLLAIEGIAELPAKLKARIELGRQRAAEAQKAKPKAEAPAEAQAEAKAAEEAPAAEEMAAEAKAAEEAPAAEETPAEAKPATEEAPAEQEQPQQEGASAEAEEQTDQPNAEAGQEEKAEA